MRCEGNQRELMIDCMNENVTPPQTLDEFWPDIAVRVENATACSWDCAAVVCNRSTDGPTSYHTTHNTHNAHSPNSDHVTTANAFERHSHYTAHTAYRGVTQPDQPTHSPAAVGRCWKCLFNGQSK